MIDEATFVKLAKGYIKQERYEESLRDAIMKTAGEHGQEKDFLGLCMGADLIMNSVLDVLGDDFSYYHYECHDDVDRFNSDTTLADGTHPNIRSLEDLYKFTKEQGGV